MQKFKFSQSVLNYANCDFEYDINVDASERKEFKSENIIKCIKFANLLAYEIKVHKTLL